MITFNFVNPVTRLQHTLSSISQGVGLSFDTFAIILAAVVLGFSVYYFAVAILDSVFGWALRRHAESAQQIDDLRGLRHTQQQQYKSTFYRRAA